MCLGKGWIDSIFSEAFGSGFAYTRGALDLFRLPTAHEKALFCLDVCIYTGVDPNCNRLDFEMVESARNVN